MPDLLIHLSDDVFSDLNYAVYQKRMDNKFGGVEDMFVLAILEAMKKKQSERTVKYKMFTKVICAAGK